MLRFYTTVSTVVLELVPILGLLLSNSKSVDPRLSKANIVYSAPVLKEVKEAEMELLNYSDGIGILQIRFTPILRYCEIICSHCSHMVFIHVLEKLKFVFVDNEILLC